MKKLALTVAVAAATAGSIDAQATTAFFNFEALRQTIECVRKPGTDYMVCTNKIVDSEDVEGITSEPVVEPTPEPEGNQWFSEAVDIEIPEFYWPLIHETIDGPHIEFVDAMDFDNDGLMDLALFTGVNRGRYWGEAGPGPLYQGNGEETFDDLYGPSWASEVFLRQTEPGVYEVWNYELFGEDFINPGGLSRKRVLGDFNGDGYTDLVRTQATEDGRRTTKIAGYGTDREDDPYLDNWMSQQKAYMSNGDGTYRMEDLGDLVMWAHAITSAKNENGDLDIVFPSYDNETTRNPWTGPANAFTYQGDYQQEYGDYPELGGWDIMASDPVDVGDKNYSKYIADAVEFRENDETYAQGYRVFEQVNGKFELLTTFELSTIVGTVDVYMDDKNTQVGQENIRTFPLWEIQGIDKKLVNHTWADSCSLKINDSEAIFVSMGDGSTVPDDQDLNETLYLEDFSRSKVLFAWKIEDGEVVMLDHIFDEHWDNPTTSRYFECADINDDGLDDLMVWSTGEPGDKWGGVGNDDFPRVYINNGQGDLDFTPIKGLDEIEFMRGDHNIEKWGSGIRSELKDVNGDGIGDFVHHIYGKHTLRIQYGLKPQK